MNRKFAIAIAALSIATLSACSKVPAGNVGVKAYLLGSEKGVDTQQLGPGRYWIGWNEELYLFPTFTQNYTWAKVEEKNEELGFQTNEGLAVTADVGISYQIDPNKAALIFQKYRKGVDEITNTYLRNMVRDALVKHASNLPVESVYGSGKAKLLESVQKDVAAQVDPIGIKIEKIYWVGELRLPASVVQSINAKIQMTQQAQQAQNQVAKAEADARVKIANAQGAAESLKIISEAQADAIRVKAAAISANPAVIQMQAVEKWDGKLPVTNAGGAVPFLNVK